MFTYMAYSTISRRLRALRFNDKLLRYMRAKLRLRKCRLARRYLNSVVQLGRFGV